jgi:hypothetical protein
MIDWSGRMTGRIFQDQDRSPNFISQSRQELILPLEFNCLWWKICRLKFKFLSNVFNSQGLIDHQSLQLSMIQERQSVSQATMCQSQRESQQRHFCLLIYRHSIRDSAFNSHSLFQHSLMGVKYMAMWIIFKSKVVIENRCSILFLVDYWNLSSQLISDKIPQDLWPLLKSSDKNLPVSRNSIQYPSTKSSAIILVWFKGN